MATGAPLPVREYASVDEMRRHAAEVRARLLGAPLPAARLPKKPAAPKAWAKPKIEEQGLVTAQALAAEPAYKPLPHPIRRMTVLVSNVSGVRLTDPRSERKLADHVKARQILFFLCRTFLNFSLTDIGRRVDGKHHTTVLHGIRRVQAVIESRDIQIGVCPVELAETLWAAKWPKWSQ